MSSRFCGDQFVAFVRPMVEAGDLELLLRHLDRQWPNTGLRELLFSEHIDAVKLALFCLSLNGTPEDCPAVGCLLRHEDAFISRLAEHSLWSIWLRGGSDWANTQLRRAVRLTGEEQWTEALALLNAIADREPEFAEVYNQRGIVHFLTGDYEQARLDLEGVIRRNPSHYAAMSVLGHSLAAVGRWDEALTWYERALHLHPRAEGLPEAVRELRQAVQNHGLPEARPLSPIPPADCRAAWSAKPEISDTSGLA